MKTVYTKIKPYVTKDGSIIRELFHPDRHGPGSQSLAEATVPAGTRTRLHRHRQTEEIYHVTAGTGRMRLGDEIFDVKPGDTILIRPGTAHRIEARGEVTMKILCVCVPPYLHDDTEVLEEADGSSICPDDGF